MALDLTSVAEILQDEFAKTNPNVRLVAIKIDDETDGYRVQVRKVTYGHSRPVDMAAVRSADDPPSALMGALRAATREIVDKIDPPGGP